MKLKSFLLLTILFLIFLSFFFLIWFLSRPIVENDEGIYWATFLLVDRGYSLYKEISFSQLPGFFLTVYPIFKVFGSTIAAARFGVLFWSMSALLSIVWLGYIKKNLFISLLSVVLLFTVPTYFNQSITLQSDMVAVSFSTLSFVFLITFINIKNYTSSDPDVTSGESRSLYKMFSTSSNSMQVHIWLLLSSLFFSFAILTKFDYSLILPFGFILLTQKKKRIFNVSLFLISSVLVIFITLNFFGIQVIANSVLSLREKALEVYSFEPLKIFELLKKDIVLFVLIFANIFYAFVRWRKDLIFSSFFLWLISSLFLVFSFRPLFPHHLVFLTIPAVLLFAERISIKHLIEIKTIVFLLIALVSFRNNFFNMLSWQDTISIKEREVARNFILKYTDKYDSIVTDEAALYGMTGRLPPPELVDTSFVQVRSGNISSEKFNALIKKYKPKLIIAWNERLNEIKNFEKLIEDYKKVYFSENKNIFILEQ